MINQTQFRRLFAVPIAALAIAAFAACSGDEAPAASPTTEVTSVASTPPPTLTETVLDAICATTGLTPQQTEGPYFTAGSPERASLVDGGMPGTRLVITGTVMTADCKPVANAVLDFWQADASGAYDNTGYILRGHQTADASGRFRLETIVPGEYPGRTPHIHVKVQAPGGKVLTTQLYLDNASNANDGIFNKALLMDATTAASGVDATFTFVIAGP